MRVDGGDDDVRADEEHVGAERAGSLEAGRGAGREKKKAEKEEEEEEETADGETSTRERVAARALVASASGDDVRRPCRARLSSCTAGRRLLARAVPLGRR